MPSSASGRSEIEWPARWQREAIEAVLPYIGSDERLRILVDDPQKAIHGTQIEGHVSVENATPMIIYDRSDRPDVFSWPLLSGPVLRIEVLRPRRCPLVLFTHPDWKPRASA
jgi:hypothetical protein